MESKKIKKIEHYVYDSITEFHQHRAHLKGIRDNDDEVKKNWKDANEGDWVYSDDGRIIQLLRVRNTIKHPNDRKNYKHSNGWVRTVVGTFLKNDKSNMDTSFEKHPNRYTFSRKIKNTGTRVKERENCTNKEKEFATQIVVGKTAVKSYMETFNEKNPSSARKKAVVLLKQERIMKEIEKTVGDVATELGIDHEYILARLKYLVDHSEDENISLQSVKELGKAIGTLGPPVKKIETGVLGMFQGFDPDQIESAKREVLEPIKEL